MSHNRLSQYFAELDRFRRSNRKKARLNVPDGFAPIPQFLLDAVPAEQRELQADLYRQAYEAARTKLAGE